MWIQKMSFCMKSKSIGDKGVDLILIKFIMNNTC